MNRAKTLQVYEYIKLMPASQHPHALRDIRWRGELLALMPVQRDGAGRQCERRDAARIQEPFKSVHVLAQAATCGAGLECIMNMMNSP